MNCKNCGMPLEEDNKSGLCEVCEEEEMDDAGEDGKTEGLDEDVEKALNLDSDEDSLGDGDDWEDDDDDWGDDY